MTFTDFNPDQSMCNQRVRLDRILDFAKEKTMLETLFEMTIR